MPHQKKEPIANSPVMNKLPDEKILFSVHPSIVPTIIMIVVVLVVGSIFYGVLDIVGVLAISPFFISVVYWLVIVYLILILILEQSATIYRVSDKRLQIKSGIIGSRVRSIDMDQVETISVDQNIIGTFFNYGTVAIESAAAKLSLSFKNVTEPKKKAAIIDDQA